MSVGMLEMKCTMQQAKKRKSFHCSEGIQAELNLV